MQHLTIMASYRDACSDKSDMVSSSDWKEQGLAGQSWSEPRLAALPALVQVQELACPSARARSYPVCLSVCSFMHRGRLSLAWS